MFKTTVKNKTQVKKVAPLLNGLLSPCAKWNFDLSDCDKVLRIESLHQTIDEKVIIQEFQNYGQTIEVMPD
ncbi:hypothetical protein [Emticicia sp. SJ17W-69]|uniref:hypothetical protein n=1 Tax=Emticicia sp. SJ17W-69 TaxID=3421657 RepID=UPI003EBD3C86